MRRILKLLCLSCVAGCLPTSFAPPTDGRPAGATAESSRGFTELERGAYSGMVAPGESVIRARSELAALLERVSIGRSPAAAPPPVDFEREMVLAVFLGVRRTGGYAIEITAVSVGPDELQVVVHETSPPSNAITTQAITAPYHLVKVPRTDLPVRFLRQ